MRIQHNIMAMSAYRNYTNNVSAMKKNLEKLSSGYKINRAGDDAAGLAISEKMRAQITGLETAQKNAKDGISLVQTAEGALTEVHDMLNRMVELATQSANGTYSDETDREQLQKEITQLQEEINRISEASNFNGIKLLNGNMDQGGGKVKGDFVIPEVGNPLGDNTYTHGSGTTKAKTEFELHLDTLSVTPAEDGATLDVDIGGNKVTVALTKDTTYDAGKLADEIAKAFNAKAGTTNKIGGQAFTITADTTKGVVKFVQTAEPTSDAEVVDGSMDVKISYTPKKNGTPTVLNDGGFALLADQGGSNASLNAGVTFTGNDSGWAEKDEVQFTSAGDTKLNLTFVKNDSGWALKEGSTAPDGYEAVFDGTTLTVSKQDPGAVANESPFGELTVTVSKADQSSVTGKAENPVWADGEDPIEDGGEDEDGNKTETVTGKTAVTGAGLKTLDPDKMTEDTTIDATDSAAINTWLQTAQVTVDGHNIDLSGVSIKTGGDATVKELAEAIGAAAKEQLGKVTDATYSDIKVTIGKVGPIMALAAGGDFDITVTATKAAKGAGGTTGGAAGVSGNYNASTVNIKQGAAEKAGSYASTTFNLSDLGSDIGDGSVVVGQQIEADKNSTKE